MALRGPWRALSLGLAAGALMAATSPHAHKAPVPAADTPDAAAPDAAHETSHTVRPGETLDGVANRAGVPREAIIAANGLKAPYRLRAGQHLALPRTRRHTVARGESRFDIALRYGVSWSSIAVANGLEADAPLKPGQRLLIPSLMDAKAPAETDLNLAPAKGEEAPRHASRTASKSDAPTQASADTPETSPSRSATAARPFLWPVAGKLRRGFTPRDESDWHDGLDISAPAGAPVRAAAGGTVIFAGREPQNFGNLVVIEHEDGWQTAYAFLSRITVKKGDVVKPRERVGLVGHTGKTTRDELHFEIRHHNEAVDPEPLLPRLTAGSAPLRDKASPPARARGTRKPAAD